MTIQSPKLYYKIISTSIINIRLLGIHVPYRVEDAEWYVIRWSQSEYNRCTQTSLM